MKYRTTDVQQNGGNSPDFTRQGDKHNIMRHEAKNSKSRIHFNLSSYPVSTYEAAVVQYVYTAKYMKYPESKFELFCTDGV